MRHLFILAVAFIFFIGCKKDGSTSTASHPNTIKLTIDGKEYVSSAGKNFNSTTDHTWIESALEKRDGYSDFYILIYGTSVDFNLNILYSKGPANGLGVFQIPEGELDENFSGGESYNILNGQFNITKSEVNDIEGTIFLVLNNTERTKTVNGTFVIKEPHH